MSLSPAYLGGILYLKEGEWELVEANGEVFIDHIISEDDMSDLHRAHSAAVGTESRKECVHCNKPIPERLMVMATLLCM